MYTLYILRVHQTVCLNLMVEADIKVVRIKQYFTRLLRTQASLSPLYHETLNSKACFIQKRLLLHIQTTIMVDDC